MLNKNVGVYEFTYTNTEAVWLIYANDYVAVNSRIIVLQYTNTGEYPEAGAPTRQ